ncbi:MAG: deoxyribose-phosphate aldolase [Fermentimonas sp.]|jgi:deoxyribose-phosphate aldolase
MEIDKHKEAINKHKLSHTDEQIKSAVEKLLEEKFEENNNIETLKKLYSFIDLTSLNSTDSREKIWKFTEKVNEFEGSNPEVDNVAAICVYPNLVSSVKESLTANVRIAAVAGGFPSSQTFLEIKVAETALAIADGADEIDIVINLGEFLDGDYEEMCDEIMEIKSSCHGKTLKVILETGALITAENIYNASILSMYSGADFIKSSTGKGYPGATSETIYVMCLAIKSYFEKTGNKVGIKVSGGVSTTEDAVKYYTIIKELLGEEWCNAELFRIGTSRLADLLLAKIEQ